MKMKKLKTTTTNFAHVKRENKREKKGERKRKGRSQVGREGNIVTRAAQKVE